MDPQLDSAHQLFNRIYLEGIPILLKQNETAFLSFLCVAAATDALAAYCYEIEDVGDRFRRFVERYFPEEYKAHAANLYLFRCRMLHNFSPAHFRLIHATAHAHLQKSEVGDYFLDDGSFFSHMREAAQRFFEDLRQDESLQVKMLARLRNLDRGGSIYVGSTTGMKSSDRPQLSTGGLTVDDGVSS